MDHKYYPSSYASGPNTPIASQKRVPVTSPRGNVAPPSFNHLSLRVDANAPTRQRALEPPTPSKNLFSPSLRTGKDGKDLVSHHENDLSMDSDNDDLRLAYADHNTALDDGEISDGSLGEYNEYQAISPEIFNPYHFISSLPRHSTVARNVTLLPKKTCNRPTLVLDLDETLVHCSMEAVTGYDLIFPVNLQGNNIQVYARKRPHLDFFLKSISQFYEVVLFTASQSVYADVLLDILDPKKEYIQHRLFREGCLLVHGNYVKDLSVLGRDLAKTVLVDNSPHAYAYQVDNGIPIESWYDENDDTELLKLLKFLEITRSVPDVRPIVHSQFKTYRLVRRAAHGLPVPLNAPPF